MVFSGKGATLPGGERIPDLVHVWEEGVTSIMAPETGWYMGGDNSKGQGMSTGALLWGCLCKGVASLGGGHKGCWVEGDNCGWFLLGETVTAGEGHGHGRASGGRVHADRSLLESSQRVSEAGFSLGTQWLHAISRGTVLWSVCLRTTV